MENAFESQNKAEERQEEIRKYIGGLSRYAQRGIPILMDGKPSDPVDWERLFEVREDGMFYMGDYVQAETGELKEIRFDRVYLCESDLIKGETKKKEKNKTE